MSTGARLQKVILGPDWIDLSFGEPKVVTEALFRQVNRVGSTFKFPNLYDLPSWEYPPGAGKPDLISILEEKYDAKVVICNGAKQALGASLHALQRAGNRHVYFPKPYYPPTLSIAESAGLTWRPEQDADCFLVTSPNNPDGNNKTNVELLSWRHKGPTIHDAAYYTELYLPADQVPIPLGHIQVYSMSKMFGLSGLRIGYAVVHEERYYQDIVNYVETSTAGVSAPSQDIARNIELFFRDHPEYYKEFIKEARASIALAREELKRLDPDVLELIPSNGLSMFAWFKRGKALDNQAAKVHILDGSLFGTPGMMRMNIAYPPELIREAVDRLNKHKI